MERLDENDHCQKLVAVAEGPYQVDQATRNTLLLERPDKSAERVSRDRVTSALRARTTADIHEAMPSMTYEKIKQSEYPTAEVDNVLHLARANVALENKGQKKSKITNQSSRRGRRAIITNTARCGGRHASRLPGWWPRCGNQPHRFGHEQWETSNQKPC